MKKATINPTDSLTTVKTVHMPSDTSGSTDVLAPAAKYLIGSYDRPHLKEYSSFDSGDDLTELFARCVGLAFDHACTGPGDMYQKAGARYQVRAAQSDEVLADVEVTEQGNRALTLIAAEMLKRDITGIRDWGKIDYPDWTARKDRPVCVGDRRVLIEQILIPQLSVGMYRFDSPETWPIVLSQQIMRLAARTS